MSEKSQLRRLFKFSHVETTPRDVMGLSKTNLAILAKNTGRICLDLKMIPTV